MPTGQDPAATDDDESQTGQENQDPKNPPTGETPPGDTWEDGTPFDAEKAKKTIDRLRGEERKAKELQKQNDELAAKVKEHDREKLSETERIQAERDDLKKQNEQLQARIEEDYQRNEILRTARTLGFIDEEDAYLLVDKTKLARDDEGRFTNTKKVLDELAKAKPHLVGEQAQGNNSDGRSQGPPPTPPRRNGSSNDAEVAEANRKTLLETGRYSM